MVSESSASGDSQQSAEAAFSVLAGNPTAEELAVVVAVLQAAASASARNFSDSNSQPMSSWSRNLGLLRVPVAPGNGQWQAAYRRGLTR